MPPAAAAAVDSLQRSGFLAAADASLSAWRNAARPGAESEAARSVALIIAAARRFDRSVDGFPAALRVLAARGVRLDAAYWEARQRPDSTADGDAVAVVLVELAGAFPGKTGSG